MESPSDINKARLIDHWDHAAAGYEDWYCNERGRVFVEVERRSLLEALQPQRDHRLLEIGCGSGRVTAMLANYYSNLDALDFSEESLQVLRQRTRDAPATIRTHAVDITQGLPFADATFERIAAIQSLVHIEPHNHAAVFREINRVLKPGGRLVFTVYRFGRWIRGEKVEFAKGIYRYAYDREEIARLLEGIGHEAIRIRGQLNLSGRLYAASKRIRWLEKILVLLDLWLERSPLSCRTGVYLLSRSQKPERGARIS